MTRYRSKPSTVEAVQWTGDNAGEVRAFIAEHDPIVRGSDSLGLFDAEDYWMLWGSGGRALIDPGDYVAARDPGPGVHLIHRARFEARWELDEEVLRG